MARLAPNAINEGRYGRIFPADKMYTYVKGFLTGAGMHESVRALLYMREAHATHIRDDGQRYETHPLSMVCYALSLRALATNAKGEPLIDDATIATYLLHDVPEELGIKVESMPFSDKVLIGVKYMTVAERFLIETKYEQKRRYSNELLENWRSILCKCGDMQHNLSTMIPVFSDDKIRKNIVETDLLRMPVIREAKLKYSDLTPLLWIYRENIRNVLYNLASVYKVRLTDENYVNPPDAQDYSYLVTGEKPVNEIEHD